MDYKIALIAIQAILETCDEKTKNRIIKSLRRDKKAEKPFKFTNEYFDEILDRYLY